MLNVTIIDDNKDVLSIIQSIVQKNLPEPSRIFAYSDPEAFLYDLNKSNQSDIYFLDIEMPHYNGLDLAKTIRQLSDNTYIIFLTSHPEYALKGYDLEIKADYYILKSQMQEQLPAIIQHMLDRISNKHYYIIKNTFHFIKLDLDDVYYIHKSSKNAVIYTKHGIYEERKSLEQLLKDMDFPDLITTDRSTIVNIQHVKYIETNQLFLEDGTEITISRSRIKKVKEAIAEYWSEHI